MLVGFAITQHCNLRCPHCIRDDVTTVQNLGVELIRSVLDQARQLFGDVEVSLTGGEPLLHKDFAQLVEVFAARGVAYRFVSNGWHMGRVMPVLDRYPPSWVRLSLSGAREESHDAVRGRGSFRKVQQAALLLTSRRIPTSFSLVVDRTSRQELAVAADLAESLGVLGLQFILPQPVTGSLEADSEVPPDEWLAVRHEVEAIARQPGRRVAMGLDYGAPFEGSETPCDTMALRRIYVDAWGRLATCCQLSDYGFNQSEVVADLKVVPLAQAYELYRARIDALIAATRPTGEALLDRLPCMRCAHACGKLDWLRDYPQTAWGRLLADRSPARGTAGRSLPVLAA